MSTIKEILGETVVANDGQEVPVANFATEGKYVGLYFSAHWCPPCRGFTPVLTDFYNKRLAKGDLEIVFVSFDRDENSYKEYYATMPWKSLKWDDEKKAQTELGEKYGVSGIPALIILDGSTGEVINPNARGDVQSDSEGAKFPWKK